MTSSVTYSPEDNKLRLYVGRVPRADYERLRAAGFISTPKQDCDFVATWSPRREDLAREFIPEDEDIGDEDYSVTERAADRAERFEGYREKRTNEAVGHAENYESGPQVFGHQNEQRAQRQADRHERVKHRALSQWSKAEYWQNRTAGVIGHALHKADPSTRRGRILTLEAEQRKHLKSLEEWQANYDLWKSILTMEGAEIPIPEEGESKDWNKAQKIAYTLANHGASFWHAYHPRCEEANAIAKEIWKHGFSAYDLLTKTEIRGIQLERLSPKEVAELWLKSHSDPRDPENGWNRWSRHYELRLTYERAMLENEGGTAAEVDMIPGGWIGGHQIHKVNKSPATGRVVSVTLEMPGDRWGNSKSGSHKRAYNIERMPAGAYRPPTEEELQAFKVATASRKAAAKAVAEPTLPLINPTEEDAIRLQKILNDMAKAKHDANRKSWEKNAAYDYVPTTVLRMTQAQYSENSKGAYSRFETRTVHQSGGIVSRRSSNMYSSEGSAYDKALGKAVCKIRARVSNNWGVPHIIVITDKPQKALPVDWTILESLTQVQHAVA